MVSIVRGSKLSKQSDLRFPHLLTSADTIGMARIIYGTADQEHFAGRLVAVDNAFNVRFGGETLSALAHRFEKSAIRQS